MRRLLPPALGALLLATSAQAAPAPRAAEFGMAVPQTAVHAASGGLVTTALRAPHRFDLVGAHWRSGSGKVWVRGRRFGRRWSPWVELSPSEEPTRSGNGTEPAWAGGDDLVQVRTSRRLGGLRLRFVDASVPAALAARTRRVALPSGGALTIVPRAAWGASRCRPRVTPGYGSVDFAVVHHTETLASYSRSQAPAVVLGICLFHRNSNGWNDIGYNFLVDRFGRVYEGRAGGIGEPTIGAQAGGFNAFSTGVAAIGDFRFRRFSSAGIHSLARLLAWKLSLHGVPAEGAVTVPSDGGPFTPFPSGTPVTVNRISGHRDVDSTACPGNALYAQLPALRSMVARLEGPVSSLRLSVSETRLTFPQAVRFSGRLAPAAGQAIPSGAVVEIQDGLPSGGRTLTTVGVAPDGSFSGSLPMSRGDVFQASFGGGGGLPRLVSNAVAVSLAPSVTLQPSAPSVPSRSPVTLSGTVSPAVARVVLSEYKLRGSRYRRIRSFRLRTSAGSFRRTLRLAGPATFRFVARTRASRGLRRGASAPVTVQVGA